MNLPLWLLKERRKRKLSRARLAKLSGVSLPTINRLELNSANSPTLRTVELLAYTFNMSVSEMLKQVEELK